MHMVMLILLDLNHFIYIGQYWHEVGRRDWAGLILNKNAID